MRQESNIVFSIQKYLHMLQYLTESCRKTVRRFAPWIQGGDDHDNNGSTNASHFARQCHHFGS